VRDIREISADSTMKTKVIALIVLTMVFITFWYMLNLVLLTFVFTFIFYKLRNLIQKRDRRVLPIKIPDPVVIVTLYVIFAVCLGFLIYALVPVVTAQIIELWRIVSTFDINALEKSLDPRVFDLLKQIDLNKYIADAGVMVASQATKIGGFGVTIFISLILSILLLLEKPRIKKFGKQLEASKLGTIYEYFIYFGGSFVNSFGKVMQVQVTIAFINMILSSIILTILGFPQIIGLAVMIFALGLIPVAGVIISLLPLSIIAFNIGGVIKVLAVIIMIIGIHTVEAYILNPKLMSTKTKLPVCFVFIVLIVGEHYLGVWGLLIGVPIFIFLMDIMEVQYGDI
jgi:predicted PurR-regulated permease PerM